MTGADVLSRITKPMLAELKDLYNPAAAIKLVSDALCVALGIHPSWENAKKQLWGDSRLIQRLRSYDKDNMRPAVMQKLKSIVENPNFHPNVVNRFSAAAAGICEWIHTLVATGRVQGEPLVAPYLSNAGCLQKWRIV